MVDGVSAIAAQHVSEVGIWLLATTVVSNFLAADMDDIPLSSQTTEVLTCC